MQDFIAARPLLDYGMGVFLSVIVIYWYRMDSKERVAEAVELAKHERDDKLLVIEALRENTKAMTELRTIFERIEQAQTQESTLARIRGKFTDS